jgi:hypothetical protein
MVRLVFRPYTQLKRSICTSEALQTSTRVSPGFVLAGHRSPSFGSQRVSSRCVCPGPAEAETQSKTPRDCAAGSAGKPERIVPRHRASPGLYFHFAVGVVKPIDSLTR